VLHDGKYANLPDVEEVFTVGLNRAVDLIAQKAAGGFKRGGTIAALKTFEHPEGTIAVREGRYGPYVNQGKVNATLPKTLQPADVTLEQALELIAARAAAGGGGKKSGRAAAKKAPAKKAPAKKPAAKKPAAAKPAAKKKVAAKVAAE